MEKSLWQKETIYDTVGPKPSDLLCRCSRARVMHETGTSPRRQRKPYRDDEYVDDQGHIATIHCGSRTDWRVFERENLSGE